MTPHDETPESTQPPASSAETTPLAPEASPSADTDQSAPVPVTADDTDTSASEAGATSTSPEMASTQHPLDLRPALAMIGLIITGDYFLYDGSMGGGLAIFTILASILVYVGTRSHAGNLTPFHLTILSLFVFSTAWQANDTTWFTGAVLLFYTGTWFAGYRPCALASISSFFKSIKLSLPMEVYTFRTLLKARIFSRKRQFDGWAIVIPAIVLFAFLAIFGLANPIFSSKLSDGWTWLSTYFMKTNAWLPGFWEVVFWLVMGCISMVWLYPKYVASSSIEQWFGSGEELTQQQPYSLSATNADANNAAREARIDKIASIARNTLLSVIALFAFYASQDVPYLWLGRELPKEISYSAYAIDGTIWLTVALALTSMVLGVIFCGALNFSPKTKQLRILAWIWSAENLLIALFSCQRLVMYIDFNGLTYWRTVGAFGIITVIIGLGCVIIKIRQYHSFLWMVRRQMKAFFIMFFLLMVFPADYVSSTVNTHLILNGRIGPAYQIACQPISAEGLPPLLPLLSAEDPTVRAGVASLLRRQLATLRSIQRTHTSWTYQDWAHAYALKTLKEKESLIRELAPNTPDIPLRSRSIFSKYNETLGATIITSNRMEASSPSDTSSGATELNRETENDIGNEMKNLKESTSGYSWPGRRGEGL